MNSPNDFWVFLLYNSVKYTLKEVEVQEFIPEVLHLLAVTNGFAYENWEVLERCSSDEEVGRVRLSTAQQSVL